MPRPPAPSDWMLIDRLPGQPDLYLNKDFRFVGPDAHCATHRFGSRESAVNAGREIKTRRGATLYVRPFNAGVA